MSSQTFDQEYLDLRIKEAKQAIARVQVVKAAEKLHVAIQKHDKLIGGRGDTQIMTDHDLEILQARRAANPDLYIDPVVVDRLVATVIYHRNASINFESVLRRERQQRRHEARRRMW